MAALWILDRMLSRIVNVRLYAVFVQEPDRILEIPEPNAPGYLLRVANEEDLQRAADEDTNIMSRTFIQKALLKGDVCVAAFDDTKIVSYAWCSTRKTHIDERIKVEVGENYVYGYKARTSRMHRGRGLSTAGKHFVARNVAMPLGKGVVGIVELGNDRSLMSEARGNASKFGVAVLWVRDGNMRSWISPAVRRTGICFMQD